MTLQSEGPTMSWITLAGVVLAAGLIGFSFGNGHTTQNAVANISDQLGQQKKVTANVAEVAGCQTARANIAKDTAVQSERGAEVDVSAIPNCSPLAKALSKK